MRIRTIYFKVVEMAPARAFWTRFLGVEPHKDFEDWCEFMVDGLRFAMLRLDHEEPGNACVPVFELADAPAVRAEIARATALGASVFLDGLDDPEVQSVVLLDPLGHQFELSKIHA